MLVFGHFCIKFIKVVPELTHFSYRRAKINMHRTAKGKFKPYNFVNFEKIAKFKVEKVKYQYQILKVFIKNILFVEFIFQSVKKSLFKSRLLRNGTEN